MRTKLMKFILEFAEIVTKGENQEISYMKTLQ